MPWADSVAAIVHSWYLGNSTGDAIADVLLGKKNPSGRLSLTFPKRMEDIPSYGHFHSENGKVNFDKYCGLVVQVLISFKIGPLCRRPLYGESLLFTHSVTYMLLLQGYKHYHHHKISPLFAFG
jgi:beta-glucosidase